MIQNEMCQQIKRKEKGRGKKWKEERKKDIDDRREERRGTQ